MTSSFVANWSGGRKNIAG